MRKYRRLLGHLFWLVVFVLPFLSFFNLAKSASSPWTQTDWSGGSGQTSWSDNTKFDSSSGLNASTSGQLTLSDLWYNSSWLYRRKITFDNSSQVGSLSDFTVLVILDSSRINYSNTQDSGQDIRFTDSDGTTLLSYEIERWDETGSSYVWVKVPQIDASSSTDYIYMYYGNSGATDGQNPTDTWVSSAKAVYHLKDDPNTSTVQDSTSTGNDGSKLAANEPLEENSKIGKGQLFDGTNDYILTTVSSSEYSTGSVQFWVKDSDPNTDTVLLQLCTSCGTNNSAISIANSGQRFGAWPYNSSGGAGYIQISSADTNSLFNSTWHLVTVTFTSSNSSTKVYVDGVSKSVSQLNSYVTNPRINAIFRIGSRTDGSNRFSGSMDEIRIYNAELSSSWIAATYKSESDTFNTFASEESPSAFSGVSIIMCKRLFA